MTIALAILIGFALLGFVFAGLVIIGYGYAERQARAQLEQETELRAKEMEHERAMTTTHLFHGEPRGQGSIWYVSRKRPDGEYVVFTGSGN